MKANSENARPDILAKRSLTRRDFLARSGAAAAASALAGVAIPRVHAAVDNAIRLALIGCGSRGGGAAANAFDSPNGPVKMVAMADLFQPALEKCFKVLMEKYPAQMDVPRERQFAGFDAYKRAIDCLRPGDVAMLTGYCAFRPAQLEYAVARGINVFMEKSFGPDAPALRRIIRAGEEAEKKNLKIAAGLQSRHSVNRYALLKRIQDGEMGEIHLVRAYRMQPVGILRPRPESVKELDWQLGHRNFVHFLWVSGGLYAEMNIHQIDEICWIMDALPETAHAITGRAPDSQDCSQNLHAFSIEFTFPNGAKALDIVRWLPNCHTEFATYIHGTKCAAQFSGNIHAPTTRIYKDQQIEDGTIAWRPEREVVSPYIAEWNVLLGAIRNNRPHNELKRAAYANLAAIMGRAAVHSGQIITWDQALGSDFQFSKTETFTEDTPAPARADAQGRYPVPVPGAWTEI